MMEKNKDLIDKLFAGIEEKVEARNKAQKLSKYTRVRLQNGRIVDIFLLALSNETAAISFIDVKTKAEICTVDIRQKNLQYVNLTYEKAYEIYDEILNKNQVTIINLEMTKDVL